MKAITKVMLCALILVALALVACSAPPQPVTKSQFESLQQELRDAEANKAKLQAENKQLTEELDMLTARRNYLQNLADEQK